MTKILIVDDSAFQRTHLSDILKKDGYELLEASKGKEALRIIKTQSPDCVLLDLIMPESGIEVLEAMQEQDLKIPVIVVTADIQETTRQKCLELGAAGFINKPTFSNEDKLRKLVSRVLEPDEGRK
ncbi:MAG: response regulator [Candidatus Theseobacter exili]|nr:response regulator [Candidatus Theseobacter exili]